MAEEEKEQSSDGTQNTGGGGVTFSDAQQRKLDSIISARLADIRKERDDLKSVVDELKQAESGRQEQEEERRQRDLEEKGEYEKLLEEKDKKYQEQITQLEQRNAALDAKVQSMGVDHMVDGAIKAHAGVNPQMIDIVKQQLLLGATIPDTGARLRVEALKGTDGDYDIAVTDGNGNRLPNGDGGFMSPADAVKTYLEAYPAFVLADARGGAGSGTGNTTTTASQAQAAYDNAKQKASQTGASTDVQAAILAKQQLRRQSQGG